MTQLNDSNVSFAFDGKTHELTANIDAILKLSQGQMAAIDQQGNVVAVSGLRQYAIALKELDIGRILFLLRVALDDAESTDADLYGKILASGGVAVVAEGLYAYLSLLLIGGTKSTPEKKPNKPAAKKD